MWKAIGNIPKAYYEGQDQAYKQKLRNVFSDENGGLPRDKDGNVDFQKAYERLVTVGGQPAVESAGSLATSGLTQDRIRYAPTVSGIMENPGPGVPQGGAAPAPIVSPSASRGVPRPDSHGGRQGGDSPDSLVSFVSAAGTPDELAGPHINILGGQLSKALGRRIDPNEPLDRNDPKVRQVLAGYKRGGIPEEQDGTPAQPSIVSPPSASRGASAVVAPPRNSGGVVAPQSAPAQPSNSYRGDPTLGGLIPPGYPDPGAYLARLQAIAASGRVLPDQLKTLEQKIGAIQTALQPPNELKLYDKQVSQGYKGTFEDYQNRSDENMAARDILSKSILPKLDKSQEAANAARDEIQAIHRSREQLDAPGGIFSGATADVRLKVAKVAEFLGVPNADKISNTEAFGSAIGSRVLSLVKNLGSGTAISNADRDFAAAMAGGNIKLDEKSIRKILDIGERAARLRIEQHNGLTDRTLKSSEALKGYSDVYRIEQPGQYQRIGAEPPPKVGDVVDGLRFLGGNPNERRSWGSL